MSERDGPWGGLALVFGGNVLFAAGLFSHALLYNFYLDGLGLGESAMGGAAAVLTVGGLAALIPAGQAVDRLGAKAAYFGAVALGTAGLAGGAWVRSPAAIWGMAFLAGAGTAGWRVATGPLIMGLSRDRTRARAFSWNVALLLASGAVWTAVAGGIPAWLGRTFGMGGVEGVRWGLTLGAAATAASALVLAFVRPADATPGWGEAARQDEGGSTRHDRSAAGGGRQPAALRDRIGVPAHLALLAVAVGVWMLAGGLVIPFLNLYFLRAHGFDVARIGLLFGIAQAITALVVFGSGDLAARFGARRMLLVWAAPFAPLLWVLAAAGSAVVAMVVYIAQGFVPPATNPLIDQLLLERAPRARQGAVSTWRNAATELSGLVGASLGGVLLQATTFRVLFVTAGLIAVAGFLALVLLLRVRPAD